MHIDLIIAVAYFFFFPISRHSLVTNCQWKQSIKPENLQKCQDYRLPGKIEFSVMRF